jgi:hypothetical protein
MFWTQKFSFRADPVIFDLKLQLAVNYEIFKNTNKYSTTIISNFILLTIKF